MNNPVRLCLDRRDEKKVPEFDTNFCFRTPDHTATTLHMHLVNRQLKVVRKICSAGKCEPSTQKGDIANHTALKRLVRGNLSTPLHFSAVISSAFRHAGSSDQNICIKINGNTLKMLIVGNHSVGSCRQYISTASPHVGRQGGINEVIYRTGDRYRIRPDRRRYIGVVHRTLFSLRFRSISGRVWHNCCRRRGNAYPRSGGFCFKTVPAALKTRGARS